MLKEPKTRTHDSDSRFCHCPWSTQGLFEHLAEPLIELQGNQAMVVKL
jgi:hypothetical protein